jgi:aminoglycoside 2''-phosphotransferase
MNSESYRRLVETHFPNVEIRTCIPIDMGWDYFVLDVNDELIFRFPRRPDVVRQLEWEMEILPMLRDALPVSVPEFGYIATPKEGDLSKFVGYQKIIGSPLDAEKLKTSSKQESMARSLGDFLNALHSIPLEGISDHPMSRNPDRQNSVGWRDVYRRLFEFAEEQVFPRLSQDAKSRETQTWQNFLADGSNFEFSPVLVHQDLHTEHIIADHKLGTVAGIIDWGDCGIGDPAMDFVGLLGGLGEEFVREILGYYLLADDGIMRRARFYDVVVPYHWVKFDLEAGKDKLFEGGIHAIETRQGYSQALT